MVGLGAVKAGKWPASTFLFVVARGADCSEPVVVGGAHMVMSVGMYGSTWRHVL